MKFNRTAKLQLLYSMMYFATPLILYWIALKLDTYFNSGAAYKKVISLIPETYIHNIFAVYILVAILNIAIVTMNGMREE